MAIQDFAASDPALFMVIAAFLIALLITFIYKYGSDQSAMKRVKEEVKELQAKVKEHKEDKEKMAELQKEMASKSLEQMKYSFKPMLYTFPPVILIFWWLRNLFEGTGVIFTIPVVNLGLDWLWTYILFSFIFSILVRKLLKVH